jgi:hypothetical protein
MPDWRAYVQDHLGSLSGPRTAEENGEVARELAAHLEEFHAALLARGAPEEEAFSQTCARAGNWQELRREIISAKQEGTMRVRVRQIWLPGLITFMSAYVVLCLLQRIGARPLYSHPGEPVGVISYLPWLFLLPLVGAACGYLSRRAQGDGWRVYLASCVPVLALAALFLVLFPVSFIVDKQVPPQTKVTTLIALMAGWVVLPGIALCAGVALQGLRRRPPIRR